MFILSVFIFVVAGVQPCFAEKSLVIPTAKIPGENAKLASFGGDGELVVVDPVKKSVVWKTNIETSGRELFFDFGNRNFYYFKGREMYEQEWKVGSSGKAIWKLPHEVKIDGDYQDMSKHKVFDFGKTKDEARWRVTTLQVSKDFKESIRLYEFSNGDWSILARSETDGCYPHLLGGCGKEFKKYFDGKKWDNQLGQLSRLYCNGWENSLNKAFGESCTELDEKVSLNVGKLGSLSVQVTCPMGEEPSPEFSTPLVWMGANKKSKVLFPREHPPRIAGEDEDGMINEEPAIDICRNGELATVQLYQRGLIKLFDLKTGDEVMDLKTYGVPQWMPDFKK